MQDSAHCGHLTVNESGHKGLCAPILSFPKCSWSDSQTGACSKSTWRVYKTQIRMHEHRTFFHFFVSSLISFNNVLWFKVYRSFTFFFQFTPRYFIFCSNCERNCFIFFIYFSESLLLLYRNAKNFCTFILYPATLLCLFIISNSSLVESLGFSI